MADQAFRDRATRTLAELEAAIEAAADTADADLDVQRQGNVIEVGFEDGSRVVINSHEAAGELWVASRRGGFHLRWNESAGQWLDGRSGRTLLPLLNDELSAHAGQPIALNLD